MAKFLGKSRKILLIQSKGKQILRHINLTCINWSSSVTSNWKLGSNPGLKYSPLSRNKLIVFTPLCSKEQTLVGYYAPTYSRVFSFEQNFFPPIKKEFLFPILLTIVCSPVIWWCKDSYYRHE